MRVVIVEVVTLPLYIVEVHCDCEVVLDMIMMVEVVTLSLYIMVGLCCGPVRVVLDVIVEW